MCIRDRHSIEDFSNLEIIAWLQDSNRTILQSNFADLTYLVSNDNPVANKKITVYPNPATDYLFIDLSSFNLQQNLKILISDIKGNLVYACLLYTSPSPRDRTRSRMPSSA